MKKTTDPDIFVEEDDEEVDYAATDEEKYTEKEDETKDFLGDEEGEENY